MGTFSKVPTKKEAINPLNIFSIILAILIFGLLIFIHELGHFIAARICGVTILEFAIGMGPKILSKKSKKSGTVYSWRLFPIGGYVSMQGENGMEAVQGNNGEGEDAKQFFTAGNEETEVTETEAATAETPAEPDPHSYRNQSVWKRIFISVAGPLMNLILGLVLMLVMVLASGAKQMGGTVVARFFVQYNAEESLAGLQKEDLVYAVDGERVYSFAEFKELVAAKNGQPMELTVQRLNEAQTEVLTPTLTVTLTADMFDQYFITSNSEVAGLKAGDKVVKVNKTAVHTADELSYELMQQGHKKLELTVIRDGERVTVSDLFLPTIEESGAIFGQMDFQVYAEEYNAGSVLKHTWFRSVSTVKMVFDSLSGLFTQRYGLETVSGPIGITKVISDVAQTGWVNVLYLVTVISINLGVMNLLPIPALDGGHLLIYAVEVVRRKPMNEKLEGIINAVGLLLMLALAVLIAIKDIIAL